MDSAHFRIGIPLYAADQGKEFWTDFNTQLLPYQTGNQRATSQRKTHEGNPYLEISGGGSAGEFGVRMAFFKTLSDAWQLPKVLADQITGLSFNVWGSGNDVLKVKILDLGGNLVAEASYPLKPKVVQTCVLPFAHPLAKQVVFSLVSDRPDARFGLDDVYFKTRAAQPFAPPMSDSGWLAWLKRASFHFFDWQYVTLPNDMAVVLESYSESDKVSLSGMGYAYAAFILAADEGYLSPEAAKERIRKMLNWQVRQNWFDGTGGWHGFPHHYFKKNGTYFWADVSTIDWVICAAGLRVVKQRYPDDQAIVALADTLLARPNWRAALGAGNKIAMGFNGFTGKMNDYRWGLAFSEETELVYLEAVAAGGLGPEVFGAIERKKKSGFYPSWFGAGFTYNWLQLWTGPIEPYKANATAAFHSDALTCLNAFGKPLMGLTACTTVKEVSANGFLAWSEYISHQGSTVHGAASGVIQVSPAPYGAALALPFTYDKAMLALRTYAELGYYHEYLGLPDNVRLNNLPPGTTPAPNWDPFDINTGPIMLAIEQVQGNHIGSLYRSDPAIARALAQLVASFPE